MKLNTLISVVALVVSIVAVIYSMQSRNQLDQATIDQAAERALLKREKQLVNQFRDRVYTMLEGQDLEFTEDWDPQTLDELYAPVFEIINSID